MSSTHRRAILPMSLVLALASLAAACQGTSAEPAASADAAADADDGAPPRADAGLPGVTDGGPGMPDGAAETGPTNAVCGDGIVSASEECDDKNLVDDDACRNDCKRPTCAFVDGSNHAAILGMAANLGGGQPLATAMANSGVPGLSVAIRDVDGIVYAAVFGSAYNQAFDPNAPPLSPSTLFQAGSISKAVSALAYHVSAGSVAMNNVEIAPAIQSFLVPPYAITPADLLSHAAGTGPHGMGGGYLVTDPLPTTQQIVLGTSPSTSPVVTFDPLKVGIFSYSGGGFLLWQAWLEKVSQKALGQFVRDNLLLAAGARRSSFTQPLTSAIDHDAACGHSSNLVNKSLCRKVYPELAAAGLWTTPAELACVARYVTKQRPAALATVASRGLAVDFDNGTYPQVMGLGLFHRPANGVDETQGHLYEHSGVNDGFLSQMVFFDDGRAIVAMDNGTAANGGISGFSVRALCRELGWPCQGKSLAPN